MGRKEARESAFKIQFKLDKYARNLVKYADEIEDDYSIPIVNKRIAVSPISIIGESCSQRNYIKIALTTPGPETPIFKVHCGSP